MLVMCVAILSLLSKQLMGKSFEEILLILGGSYLASVHGSDDDRHHR